MKKKGWGRGMKIGLKDGPQAIYLETDFAQQSHWFLILRLYVYTVYSGLDVSRAF